MRHFLIIKPRLDIPFKKPSDIPISNPRLSYVRTFWKKFVDGLQAYHINKGDQVKILELPAWEINDLKFNPDVITYVPHRIPEQLGSPKNVLYYHQTAFPENFTVDLNGWGPRSTFFPLNLTKDDNEVEQVFQDKKKKFLSGQVKFPENMPFELGKYDAVFMAQIPHDESIKFFSKISVKDAFLRTIFYCKNNGLSLFLKLHPANPHSNIELIEIAKAHNIPVSTSKIQDCLANIDKVFLVNSGSAFQAILMEKEVIYFGETEYKQVAKSFWDLINGDKLYNKENYKKFVWSYIQNTVDVEDYRTYERIEKCLDMMNV